MLTESDLRGWMIIHLKNFGKRKGITTVNGGTIHKTILSAGDGIGNSNSKMLYKGVIKFHLSDNGNPLVTWPTNWLDLSVKDLAAKLI